MISNANFSQVPPDKEDSHRDCLPGLEDSPKCSFPNISHIFNIVPGILQAKQFWIEEKGHALVHWVGVQPVQEQLGGQSGESWCLRLSETTEQFSVSVCTGLNQEITGHISSWAYFFQDGKGRCSRAIERALQQGVMTCPQSPGHLRLWHRSLTKLALGCRRQREGCCPLPGVHRTLLSETRKPFFQSSISCTELGSKLYLFLFFHCFR